MRENISFASTNSAEKTNTASVCVIIKSVPSATLDRTWRIQTSFASDGRIKGTCGRLIRNCAVA